MYDGVARQAKTLELRRADCATEEGQKTYGMGRLMDGEAGGAVTVLLDKSWLACLSVQCNVECRMEVVSLRLLGSSARCSAKEGRRAKFRGIKWYAPRASRRRVTPKLLPWQPERCRGLELAVVLEEMNEERRCREEKLSCESPRKGFPIPEKCKQGASSATPCFGRGGVESCMAGQAPPISFTVSLS